MSNRSSSITSAATAGSSSSELGKDAMKLEHSTPDSLGSGFSSAFTKSLALVEQQQNDADTRPNHVQHSLSSLMGMKRKQPDTGHLAIAGKSEPDNFLGAERRETQGGDELHEQERTTIPRQEEEEELNLDLHETADNVQKQIQPRNAIAKKKRTKKQKKNKPSALELKLQNIRQPAPKPVAQLPQPEPVPEPAVPSIDGPWTDVVKKGGKRSGNWETVGPFRTEVNMTAYSAGLLQENEPPKPAVPVRFKMGGKHEAKFTLPRSTVED